MKKITDEAIKEAIKNGNQTSRRIADYINANHTNVQMYLKKMVDKEQLEVADKIGSTYIYKIK